MKSLGWKCRGICNASTARALLELIRAHHPEVHFLYEKLVRVMQKVGNSVGFSEKINC